MSFRDGFNAGDGFVVDQITPIQLWHIFNDSQKRYIPISFAWRSAAKIIQLNTPNS